MSMLLTRARSSVGKKLLTGVTGAGLLLFVVLHLAGNLLVFAGPEAFNSYSHGLHALGHGVLLYAAEVGLLAFLVLHVTSGASVALSRRRARPVGYQASGRAGGTSRRTLASTTMIFSGLFLLVYVVLHLAHFKFGPGPEDGYVATAQGVRCWDVYRLVIEEFQRPWIAFGYAASMLVLGLHLRHGVWSLFQSLGATHPRVLPLLYGGGGVLALVLALGFVVLPVYIYFFIQPGA